jgi:hypothetical protein
VGDGVFFGAVGAVLGGRIGYSLFYGFEQFARDPLFILRIWEGGMSFHGGLIGAVLGLAWFARRRGRRFLRSPTSLRRWCPSVSASAGSATSPTPSCPGGRPSRCSA